MYQEDGDVGPSNKLSSSNHKLRCAGWSPSIRMKHVFMINWFTLNTTPVHCYWFWIRLISIKWINKLSWSCIYLCTLEWLQVVKEIGWFIIGAPNYNIWWWSCCFGIVFGLIKVCIGIVNVWNFGYWFGFSMIVLGIMGDNISNIH